MIGDVNQSASASAEANAFKFSDNNLYFNSYRSGDSDGPGAIAKIVRTISPAFYERRAAEAREIKTESVISSVRRLLDEFPVMSERRAVMEAMGYRMTNEQADNVVSVLEQARDGLDFEKDDTTPIKPETRDAVVDGAKEAYDKDARELWAKLVSGEMKTPGTFSKRSISTLTLMGPEEAASFKTLCSFCASLFFLTADSSNLVVIEVSENGSYNGGALSMDKQSNLESLGLINSLITRTPAIEPGSALPFILGKRPFMAINKTESKKQLSFSPILTKSGRELANLCRDEIGTFNDLPKYLKQQLEGKGLTVVG